MMLPTDFIVKSVARAMRLVFFCFLAFSAISYAAAENGETVKTKEIKYRDGIVTFSIPKHWVEEYEPEGDGIFYEKGENKGKLRINVVTVNLPKMVAANSGAKALCILKDIKSSEVDNLPNGNAVAKIIEHTTEQGQPVTHYWWYVARPIPPQHVRMATFSYTIRSSQEKSPRMEADVQFLDGSIRNSIFHPLHDL